MTQLEGDAEARNWAMRLEKLRFTGASRSSGLTMPAEMIVRKASSTLISRSRTDLSGTRVYQPVVGFGAVGMNTLNRGSFKSD
jgi:hypothetical protein